MFEFADVDELAERLLASAPVDESDGLIQITPDLDPDRRWVDRLVLLERVTSAAEAEKMQIMAAMCDRAETWQDRHDPRRRDQVGSDDLAAAEIAPALHLSPVTAAIKVERAQRIVHDLPATHRAMRRGDLDLGRVLAIDDATKIFSERGLAGRVEREVLGKAVDQTAGELRRSVERAVITVDPDAAERRRRKAIRDRDVTRFSLKDGTSAIRAVLSAIDTGEIYDLVDQVARRTKTTDDTRNMGERRADALVHLLLGRDPHLGPQDSDDPAPADPPSAGDRAPSPGDDTDRYDTSATSPPPDEPEPDLHHERDTVERFRPDPDDPGPAEPDDPDTAPPDPTDWFDHAERDRARGRLQQISELAALALSAMTQRRAPRLPWVAVNTVTRVDGSAVLVGELAGYGPITGEYAQHLLDIEAARPPDQPSGRVPTPAQARTHDPPGWLAREVRARDGTCRFPGCARHVETGDLDHTEPHPNGLTVRANLGGLCRRHHRVKHSGCWTVHQHDDGIYHWTSEITGRTYTTHPRGHTGEWRGTTTHQS